MPGKNFTNGAEIDRADEYFDFIDVLGFLWRAKVFLISGLTLGVVAAVGTANAKKPPVYIATVPVNLEVAGGISSDGIITKFNELIARGDVQKSLESARVGFVAGKPPFKLSLEHGRASLDVSTLTADSTGERALAASETLTMAARDLNKKLTDAAGSSGGQKAETSDLERKLTKLMAAQASEESTPRLKLFALESKLAQKSGLRPIPAASYRGNSLGDDVLRLLAAAEARLSAEEKAAILAEYSKLTGEIRSIQIKYDQPISEMTSAIGGLSASVLKTATGEGDLFPVVEVDEPAFKSLVAAGTHERYESKKSLFIALGAILGATLGLMTYGAVLFFRSNASRLRKIIS
jgi:hypothetical protein